jgi:ABC-type transport system involved in multi-copper enzyme maturation permease subunit
MSVFPVIMRELRGQSRQPLTFWLRIGGVVCIAAAAVLAMLTVRSMNDPQAFGWGRPAPVSNPIQAFGAALFGKLNLFIFGAIWLLVPLASADAVSRERREGTLPLLYLTELRSFGIVLGKTFVHMLRSGSLFLTMAPWLILPVVFGGVSLADVRMALLLDFAALLMAQAAGLLASTIPRDWPKSVLLAELFALVLLLVMLHVHGLVLGQAVQVGMPAGMVAGTPGFWNSAYGGLWNLFHEGYGGLISGTMRLIEWTTNGLFQVDDYAFWSFGPGYRTVNFSPWENIWTSVTPAGQAFWLRGTFGMVFMAALILLAAICVGAWRVKRSWREVPAEGRLVDWRQRAFTPRFGVRTLKRSLSRALAANPIGWLQHYSPSARLVKWGWCLALVVAEIILSFNTFDLYTAQAWVGVVLLLGLTFSATGSFRQELETGAFELLLVTPLRERKIIIGRVRGLWRQFLPALLVHSVASIYLVSGWAGQGDIDEARVELARTLGGFIALPFIGLFFSLRRWNFLGAWLAACAIGLIPPGIGRKFGATEVSMLGLQLVLALGAAFLLQRRLKSRRFLQSP